MSRRWNVAVVGATGLVGSTMLSILEQRAFPVGEVHAVASARSVGRTVRFQGRDLPVQDLESFDFSKVQIERINVATYQSVSGGGQKAIDELEQQTAALAQGGTAVPKVIAKQIAFNCVPQIDVFLDNGYTKEEMKMFWETQKIMEDPSIRVNATAVRVPVHVGHSEAVHIETRRKLTETQAREILGRAPGVVVIDERKPGGYPTAVTEGAGTDPVYVGRIREDISHERGLNLWNVSDNVRKGAALNSVQI